MSNSISNHHPPRHPPGLTHKEITVKKIEKKEEIVKIHPRVTATAAADLERLHGTPSAGGVIAAEMYVNLRCITLDALSEIFTEAEKTFFLHLQNGVVFTPTDGHAYSSIELARRIKKAEELDGLCTAHNVDFLTLLQKVSGLSQTQTYFIQEWAAVFWRKPRNGKNLEDYVKKFY